MQNQPRISNGEWMVVAGLVILMGVITYTSHSHWLTSQPVKYDTPHYLDSTEISVRIEGAVKSPGIYKVHKGATVGDIVQLAGAADNADLKRMVVERKVREGQTIKVLAKEYITIYLKGAVKLPGATIVPKGTTMQELIERFEWPNEADLEALKQGKRRKDGQIVKVGYKKT
jgi:NADH:ubiquinone oxidoreductase subunit F (NADH-binding)